MNLTESIFCLLSKRKTSFKIRICLMTGKYVVLKNSKNFYNHTKNCKSCRGDHLEITRNNFDENVDLLDSIDISLIRRKSRNDLDQHHNHRIQNMTAESESYILSSSFMNNSSQAQNLFPGNESSFAPSLNEDPPAITELQIVDQSNSNFETKPEETQESQRFQN